MYWIAQIGDEVFETDTQDQGGLVKKIGDYYAGFYIPMINKLTFVHDDDGVDVDDMELHIFNKKVSDYMVDDARGHLYA